MRLKRRLIALCVLGLLALIGAQNTALAEETVIYTYDELGRLIITNRPKVGELTEFTYDDAGNRTAIAVTQGAFSDQDGDGIGDQWELDNGLDPTNPADASLDPDADNLDNLAEFLAGTDPNNPDTDGDGLQDDVDPYPLIPGAVGIEAAIKLLLED